jgi:hypothetical protein
MYHPHLNAEINALRIAERHGQADRHRAVAAAGGLRTAGGFRTAGLVSSLLLLLRRAPRQRPTEGSLMFAVHCPRHRSEVLLGPSRVRSVANLDGLIVIELECHDGERVRHYTGRRFHEFEGRRQQSSVGLEPAAQRVTTG